MSYTALHWAAVNGHAEIAQLLIDAGANLEPTNSQSATPLFMAAQHRQPKMVTILVAAGADVNTKTRSKMTPLHVCAQNNDLDSCRTLLAAASLATADLDTAREEELDTDGNIIRNSVDDHPDRAGIDKPMSSGQGPLHLAAKKGHDPMCALLIEHGARTDYSDAFGKTAAMYATTEELRTKIVRPLQKKARKKNNEPPTN